MLREVVTVLCLCVLVVSGQNNTVLPPKECPPCDCTRVDHCIEVDITDDCSCCSKCNRGVGEGCGTDEGDCSSDLLCLPDDPYSASYKGKCYEITPCLTFGCNKENGRCNCYYNNVCPIQRFPYYTKEECEDAIKIEKCKEVTCPTNDQDCSEGMYYEEGPSFLDHCCPSNGRCVCNVTLCDAGPLECGEGMELVTDKADRSEGECCDKHYCKKITCSYKGAQYTYGDTWTDGHCTNCTCTNNGTQCLTINCTLLNCSSSYIPEGQCCPVCINEPPTTIVGPLIPLAVSVCITDEGMEHNIGEEWTNDKDPCQSCTCTDSGIECSMKQCDEPLCDEEFEEQFVPTGSCCPICQNKTLTTMEPTSSPDNHDTTPNDHDTTPSDQDTTPSDHDTTPNNHNTTPSDHDATPSDHDTTPSNQDTTPSDHNTSNTNTNTHTSNLVLLLNVPYGEVRRHWNEFSMKLKTQLKQRLINVEDISIKPDTSSTVNATIFSLTLSGPVNETLKDTEHESNIAMAVNQLVIDYSMTMSQPSSDAHGSIDTPEEESQQMQMTATIIVLTLLAAITLVSFIGILVILVLINRRLKTAKTIRGKPTRPIRAP